MADRASNGQTPTREEYDAYIDRLRREVPADPITKREISEFAETVRHQDEKDT